MSEGPAVPALVRKLQAIASWRDDEQARLEERLLEVDEEVRALEAERQALHQRVESLDDAELERMQRELAGALDAEARALAVFAEEYEQARQRGIAKLTETLEADAFQVLLAEWEKLSAAQASLETLPDSYKRAIEEQRETVRRRLQPALERVRDPTPPLPEKPRAIALVAALDEHGAGCILHVIAPARADVHDRVARGDQGLDAMLAMRCVGALAGVAKSLCPQAELRCFSHHGLFACRLGLPGVELEAAKDAFDGAIQLVRQHARELAVCRVQVYVVWLHPEHVGFADEPTAIPPAPPELGRAPPTLPQLHADLQPMGLTQMAARLGVPAMQLAAVVATRHGAPPGLLSFEGSDVDALADELERDHAMRWSRG